MLILLSKILLIQKTFHMSACDFASKWVFLPNDKHEYIFKWERFLENVYTDSTQQVLIDSSHLLWNSCKYIAI